MTSADLLDRGGTSLSSPSLLQRTLSCWNWKCALLSAAARSIVYVLAMLRTGLGGSLGVVLVEMAWVTLTAGVFAGMQQKALDFRSRPGGNLIIVAGVPGLSLWLDWLAHRAAGAPAPARATLAVCVFALISALFHLHVMRRGAFLTGRNGNTLADDFRRMPRLIAAFASAPALLLFAWTARAVRAAAQTAL